MFLSMLLLFFCFKHSQPGKNENGQLMFCISLFICLFELTKQDIVENMNLRKYKSSEKQQNSNKNE